MNANHVVAGVSPVEPRPELVIWAAAEAHTRHATLRLVAAYPPRASAEDEALAQAVLGWAAALAADRRPGLPMVTRAVPGPPEHVLRVEATGADLLVIGADDHSPFVEAINGSIPAALLSTAPCPIVVVPKGSVPAPDIAPVLVGVDTAETSRSALDYAFVAADRSGRDLHAVLCWIAARDRVDRRAERVEQQRALAIALAGFAERYPDVAVTEFIVDSDPIEDLGRRSRRAGLLVLGSRGRGRLASLAFGSVSRTLIRNSHCPTVVVRPDRHAAGIAS
ncbi:MAG TPA: universal stress protein [Actinophytocola sp.]|uniref:universal stress protein n=1 Tax=Actinophytocola sp. TaxID=1872138 RepID=UPI002DB69808|nr:universal stress protein [Actinophytocola sp.]HEU5474915.1 universal stress protein [Actinophytocola sp.]